MEGGLCPHPLLPLWTSFSWSGTWGHGTRSLCGLLQSGHTSAAGKESQSTPSPFPWQPGSAHATASCRRLLGKECHVEVALGLVLEAPEGDRGWETHLGRPRPWPSSPQCNPSEGQPGHLEFGFRDHCSGVTGVLWPRLQWFVVGRGRELDGHQAADRCSCQEISCSVLASSVRGTPVPLAQLSHRRVSGEAAHSGWRPLGSWCPYSPLPKASLFLLLVGTSRQVFL